MPTIWIGTICVAPNEDGTFTVTYQLMGSSINFVACQSPSDRIADVQASIVADVQKCGPVQVAMPSFNLQGGL